MIRRGSDDEEAVASVAEAKDLARRTRERAARLREVPGLIDGGLEEVHNSLQKVLREYDRLSRGRLSAFQKELDAVAKRTKDLEDAGRLAPRHAKMLDTALVHTRRVHFWNAHRILAKIEKVLEPVREWRQGLEKYRAFQRKTSLRVREVESELARLRAIPRPPVGPEDVASMRALIESCNRAVDEAWVAQTHRLAADAIKDLVAHADVEGLGLLATQEFAALRELGDLFEAVPTLKESIGTRQLSELVLTSEFSVAKWDRVYPQAATERRKLQDLFHQLRPVVTGKHGAPFQLDADPRIQQRRVAAWRAFPGTIGADAWAQLASLLQSGQIPAIQEAARAYDRHGDLAERAWDGSLAKEIEEREADLKAARKDLAALPDPDSLSK
jgi:hypothetical protein